MPPGCHYPIASPLLQQILASALLMLRKDGRNRASEQAPLGLSSCATGFLHAHVEPPIRQATLPPHPFCSQRRGSPTGPCGSRRAARCFSHSGADSTWWASQPALFVLCLSVCLSPADEPRSRQKKPRKPCLAPSQLATQCAIGIAGAVWYYLHHKKKGNNRREILC